MVSKMIERGVSISLFRRDVVRNIEFSNVFFLKKKTLWSFLVSSCDVLAGLREVSHHSGSGQESTYMCLLP